MNLETKWKQWTEWFAGDDSYSIHRQIHDMLWSTAVFLSVNEARKYASQDEEGDVELNDAVHDLINQGFLTIQSIAIRKLVENKRIEGGNSVISLNSLIADMKQHVHLLTRKNILEVLDLPYDYEQILIDSVPRRNGRIQADIHMNAAHSETIHEDIDFLSGVSMEKRSSNDTIKPKFFDWLKSQLGPCGRIVDFTNKRIVHAATPESQNSISQARVITLKKIEKAQEMICKVATVLGEFLNRPIDNYLEIPLYDQFRHFEKPWATEEIVQNMYESWQQFYTQTGEWAGWEWRDKFGDSLKN